MASRYILFDTRTRQFLFTARPLRTRVIAQRVRQEANRLVGNPKRIVVKPGPDHKKWNPKP